MMLKKLGWIWSAYWRRRKSQKSLPSGLRSTVLTIGDMAWLGRVFSERREGMWEISCGGKITTLKPDSSTSPMRGVASCSCLSISSQAVALTTGGMNYAKCPCLKEVIQMFVKQGEGNV